MLANTYEENVYFTLASSYVKSMGECVGERGKKAGKKRGYIESCQCRAGKKETAGKKGKKGGREEDMKKIAILETCLFFWLVGILGGPK